MYVIDSLMQAMSRVTSSIKIVRLNTRKGQNPRILDPDCSTKSRTAPFPAASISLACVKLRPLREGGGGAIQYL